MTSLLFLAASMTLASSNSAKPIDLFILAGQSNMQGWQGDAAKYPADPSGEDKKTLFWWVTPGMGSSEERWKTMQAQPGCFADGHFGPEVSFSRDLVSKGYQPAIFKYSLGGTSLANDWKGPGEHGMYDSMIESLQKSLESLKKQRKKVNVRGLIWIQGESDAESDETSRQYETRLIVMLKDLREHVLHNDELPVILGVDEQHPAVQQRPIVVDAQIHLALIMKNVKFVSMKDLPKADSTHLTPAGLVEHGDRLFDAMSELLNPSKKRGR